MKKYLLFFLLNFSALVSAFELAPELSGVIKVSVKNGSIEANFKLNNIPKLSDYLIHLNSGLNLQYIRSEKDNFNYSYEKSYNTEYSEESFGYVLKKKTSNSKFIPDILHFKYTGKFPVITDMTTASDEGDWKGNIAFNGKHIRTDGFQSAWYPIIYDRKNDKRYDEVTYDIEVICLDCKSIYVNGSRPISSTKGKFRRKKPTSIILFAGDYDISEHNNNYYLNTELSPQQMTKLEILRSKIVSYYEAKLGIPYGGNLTFIETPPTTKYDTWYYVAYPSIVAMTHEGGFNSVTANWFKAFFAHELAHYYFGTLKKFNSELGDMLTESLAEFLSLKATQALNGDDVYKSRINGKLDELNDIELTALKNIKSTLDYRDRELFVYIYAPIIWLAIEKEIGSQKMWEWLNKMLTVNEMHTDYEFMISTLSEVLNDEIKLRLLVSKYFSNTKA